MNAPPKGIQNLTELAKTQLTAGPSPIWLGILNITPDSFSDGGKFLTADSLIQQAQTLVADGCHWLDVGAVSSRPGSVPCSETEEWQRLNFALPLLRQTFPHVPLSLDTFRPKVLEMACEKGWIDICNDIKAGQEGTCEVAARFGIGMILMHMQGEPRSMQKAPRYDNCIEDVTDFLKKACTKALDLGVSFAIADPGIGFGKAFEHNKTLLSAAGLKAMLDMHFPICIGLSRKSFLKLWAEPLSLDAPESRDLFSKIWENHCISYGVRLIRSHRGPRGVRFETGH